MMDPVEIGTQLRTLRERDGVSLRGLAGRVGISPSLLSQIETGKTQPSVGTLYALVNQLGISFDDLFGGGSSTQETPTQEAIPVVQRSTDNPRLTMEHGVVWERLAMGASGHVDPLLTTYHPGGASSKDGQLMSHDGTEYGYLIKGELRLHLESDSYVIRAGDSLCFDSRRPHLYVNETDRAATGVWFVVRDSPQDASMFG
ncbi:helix-turn-helix domain-containing protein [Streptomyces sp. NPDC050743]|uniref:helix-turn-helix domain-containing protein n=1 Tax=Streptomyces sp. NPDC050743 TaxID=3365634 RepID=UPI0037A39370